MFQDSAHVSMVEVMLDSDRNREGNSSGLCVLTDALAPVHWQDEWP